MFCRKKPPGAKHEEVAKLVEPGLFDKLRALVAISRAAIALDRRNTGGAVSRVTVLQVPTVLSYMTMWYVLHCPQQLGCRCQAAPHALSHGV